MCAALFFNISCNIAYTYWNSQTDYVTSTTSFFFICFINTLKCIQFKTIISLCLKFNSVKNLYTEINKSALLEFVQLKLTKKQVHLLFDTLEVYQSIMYLFGANIIQSDGNFSRSQSKCIQSKLFVLQAVFKSIRSNNRYKSS